MKTNTVKKAPAPSKKVAVKLTKKQEQDILGHVSDHGSAEHKAFKAKIAAKKPAPKADDIIGPTTKSAKGFRVSEELITRVKNYRKNDPTATLKAMKIDLKVSRHTIRKILAS